MNGNYFLNQKRNIQNLRSVKTTAPQTMLFLRQDKSIGKKHIMLLTRCFTMNQQSIQEASALVQCIKSHDTPGQQQSYNISSELLRMFSSTPHVLSYLSRLVKCQYLIFQSINDKNNKIKQERTIKHITSSSCLPEMSGNFLSLVKYWLVCPEKSQIRNCQKFE